MLLRSISTSIFKKESGSSAGAMAIPRKLSPGNIALSNWMKTGSSAETPDPSLRLVDTICGLPILFLVVKL